MYIYSINKLIILSKEMKRGLVINEYVVDKVLDEQGA